MGQIFGERREARERPGRPVSATGGPALSEKMREDQGGPPTQTSICRLVPSGGAPPGGIALRRFIGWKSVGVFEWPYLIEMTHVGQFTATSSRDVFGRIVSSRKRTFPRGSPDTEP